ncbi:MAG: PAS domain S-box protein [Kiritimatiellia bacterium]|jgi:PAS domain S-box-containing protein|nr:PAS domain S-box protein [Kiritimatiellia bacterium]
MALNFWFGKKEAKTDQAMAGDVPRETGDSAPSSSGAPAEKPVPEAQVPGASSPVAAEGPRPEPRPEPAPVSAPKADVPVLAPAVPRSSDAVAAPEASGSSKVVLKAVGNGVARLRAPGAPDALPGSGPAAVKPVAFGLRPRGGQSAAAEPAAAVPVTGPVPAVSPAPPAKAADARQGSDVVRPKPDQRVLYYQLMNGLYDALLILDDQGHVVDCSRRMEELLGFTREESWDLPVGKIVPGMTSQMFEHLKQNLAENHHILIDARCVRKDGSSFAGEVGVSTLSLTRGTNMVFAIRNVERRKNAMEDLRKSRAALDAALAPAFVCDTEGLFLIVNRALLEAFGIPDEAQARSVRFMDLLPDASRFFLRAACGEKIRETLKVMLPNGTPLKLDLALQPVQSGQNVTAVAGSLLQN